MVWPAIVRAQPAPGEASVPSSPGTRRSAVLVYEPGPNTESCPDEAGLRLLVMSRLGWDPFTSAAPLVIEAKITRDDDTFQGTMRAIDKSRLDGERRLDDASCTALAEAMALSIVTSLESLKRPGNSPSAPPIGQKALAPVTEPLAPVTLDTGDPRPPGTVGRDTQGQGAGSKALDAPALVLRAGAEVVGSLGAAPHAALGAAGLFGIRIRNWSLDLEGRVDLPSETERRSDGTAVRSSLLLGQIAPCLHRAWFLACPLVALGALQGEGIGVEDPRRDTSFYAAFGLRVGLEVPWMEGLALRLHTELVAPATRTTLKIRGEEVWTTPAAFTATGLGIVGHFQ